MWIYLSFQTYPIFHTAMFILKIHRLSPIFIFVTKKWQIWNDKDGGQWMYWDIKPRHGITWPTGLGSTRSSFGKSQQPRVLATVPTFCQLFAKSEMLFYPVRKSTRFWKQRWSIPSSLYLTLANVCLFHRLNSAFVMLLTSLRMWRKSWKGFHKTASQIVSNILPVAGTCLQLQNGTVLNEI